MPRSVVVRGRTMLEHELDCPDCGDSMAIVTERHFTGYRCRNLDCRGVHGCHPDGSPVGTPADKATRKARAVAHDAFDRIWKTGKLNRTEAYEWLAGKLKLEKDQCHIGLFDRPTCRRLVKEVKGYWPELFPFEDSDVQ